MSVGDPGATELTERDLDPDPLVQFRVWLADAEAAGIGFPEAMALATADAAFGEAAARFPGEEIPLPPHWGGYRLEPAWIEFWKGREHRLHDRFRSTRRSDGGWVLERLYP